VTSPLGAPASPCHLYRYRALRHVLELGELEKEEIYLASPDGELNDPMEGYRDIFWHGDAVLWRNFFRHYVFCLTEVAVELFLIPDGSNEEPRIHVLLSRNDLPTETHRKTVQEAEEIFLRSPVVATLVEQLTVHDFPLRRPAVLACLLQVHLVAVRSVYTAIRNSGLLPPGAEVPFTDYDESAAVERLKMRAELFSKFPVNETRDRVNALLGAESHFTEQYNNRIAFNFRGTPNAQKLTFLVVRYPGRYLDKISTHMIHARWFTACFSETWDDASMWGIYAEGHKGVVLRFDCGPQEAPVLGLDGATGVSWVKGAGQTVVRTNANYSLLKVSYSDRPPELDFFRLLGRLPRPEIDNYWLTGDAGARSARLGRIFEDLPRLQRDLWDIAQRCATTKLADWHHEREYRLLRIDNLGLVEGNRTLKYPFSSLSGIVFGMATPIEKRLEIVEIIERKRKAENRDTFALFQAGYSPHSGRLFVAPTL
jgi:hypothetical protein